MKTSSTLLVHGISLHPDSPAQEAFTVAANRLRTIGAHAEGVVYSVYRKSIDARKRDRVRILYTVAAVGAHSRLDDAALRAHDMARLSDSPLPIAFGREPMGAPPVVVGAGPGGLFCALLLAEHGYHPVIVERGDAVEARVRSVAAFEKTFALDPESNIQFGAGGAGTFSDGKLVTRIGDPYISHILRTFAAFGAPADILTQAKPHIGTDVLCTVISRMIDRIVSLGGTILYRTRFLGIREEGGRLVSVQTTVADLPAGALVLAIGHSARDTYAALMDQGFAFAPKPFSVGMRIEHRTEDIDRAMYGDLAGHPALGHAEYNLSYNTKVRGVYTFCMCPGGSVVAAAGEAGGVVTNGMSRHDRAGENSNSAVVCSIFTEDYGATPAGAIAMQRSIERAAFAAGGGDYAAPMSTVGDFLAGKRPTQLPTLVSPTYMQGSHVRLACASEYLPPFVVSGIQNALLAFDRKIQGFAAPHGILTGAETRTSAPVRMLRDQALRCALGHMDVYPVGEGAGYAGGITSAALDGVHTAITLMKRYRP